jgi:hypothetical protein
MSSLTDSQRLLWRLITAPEGVGAALAADDGGETPAALRRTVAAGPRLDAAACVDIYANMYFYRLLDVLREDHPATAAALGAPQFHNLVTDYLLAHPPSHFSLRHAGDALPDLLSAQPPAGAPPWIADLARFERALLDAGDAADAPLLTAGQLRAVPAERWPALRIAPHPSVRLLRSAWPVHVVREHVEAGESPGDPAVAPTHLCIWRQAQRVRYRAVGALEWAALASLQAGASFAQACGSAAAAGNADGGPEAVFAALSRWIAQDMLSAFANA